MVDAVGIEVFRHLAETAHPPRTAVCKHRLPVVSGESPVLAVHRESIGRRTCLSVKVEISWLHPCLHAVAAYADGNVALEHHLILTGIVVGGTHLAVKLKLHEIPERQLFVNGCGCLAHSITLFLTQ